MPRFIKRTSKKKGLSPGTLILIGEKKAEEVKIFLMNYDQEQLQEKELKNIEEAFRRVRQEVAERGRSFATLWRQIESTQST